MAGLKLRNIVFSVAFAGMFAVSGYAQSPSTEQKAEVTFQSEITRLTPLANSGDVKAQIELAKLYLSQKKDPAKLQEAVRWIKLASDNGDGLAMITLGNVYRDDLKEYSKAMEQYQAALLANEDDALVEIGNLYLWGLGFDRDYKKAMQYYKRAALKRKKNSYAKIGIMYDLGLGVPRDYKEASLWFDTFQEGLSKKPIGFDILGNNNNIDVRRCGVSSELWNIYLNHLISNLKENDTFSFRYINCGS